MSLFVCGGGGGSIERGRKKQEAFFLPHLDSPCLTSGYQFGYKKAASLGADVGRATQGRRDFESVPWGLGRALVSGGTLRSGGRVSSH